MLKKHILFLFLFPASIFCQVHVQCGPVNRLIPRFINDSVPSFEKLQPLVQQKIIPPLRQSGAQLEIRVFYYGFRGTKTIIIQCKGNDILVERYETVHSMNERYPDTAFKSTGKISPGLYLFVKHTTGLKLKYAGTWNDFFEDLINNHFFDLPDEKSINKEVLLADAHGIDDPVESAVYYEARVGKYYRNMMYTNHYSSKAGIIPAVQNQLKLEKLFYQFYK